MNIIRDRKQIDSSRCLLAQLAAGRIVLSIFCRLFRALYATLFPVTQESLVPATEKRNFRSLSLKENPAKLSHTPRSRKGPGPPCKHRLDSQNSMF